MPTQLSLYNGALREVGQTRLHTTDGLTEEVEARYLLDEVWDTDVIKTVLQLGQWNFAIRTSEITYNPSVSNPLFGYQYAFDRPTDLVRTVGFSADEYFRFPYTDYKTEASYWWAPIQTIYVRYVSDDNAYGRDMSLWPQSFTELFEAYLAKKIAPILTNGKKNDDMEKLFERRLADAQAKDAMEDPTQHDLPGSWVMSRYGNRGRGRRGFSGSI